MSIYFATGINQIIFNKKYTDQLSNLILNSIFSYLLIKVFLRKILLNIMC